MTAKLRQILDADLIPLEKNSVTQMLKGYSLRFNAPVIVKIFAEEFYDQYALEKAVLEHLQRPILLAQKVVTEKNIYILVQPDTNLVTLSTPLTVTTAYKMGVSVNELHQKLLDFKQAPQQHSFQRNIYLIKKVTAADLQQQLLKLEELFQRYHSYLERDLDHGTTITLHGNISQDKFKQQQDQLLLVDFEHVCQGLAYQDFVKLFYQDFQLQENLIKSFLLGYQQKGSQLAPLLITRNFLVFTTAIQLLHQSQNVHERQQYQMALKMIADVQDYFATRKIH
ncbi:phosphotransferase [Bombilactobacillus bombi]|uniref:phosphotransferase n=1 Tax=Bombilactobacillus bombi TaxID=1303590 RepID=UPI0015E5D720|nr:phosphotransferase [Bombilactobacillus bombi]MBA1434429.1 hypothetical protein [Bombilactobacillus bombi]